MTRYVPQMMVPEIGKAGQEKIRQAKVLIIGAGGLGTPVASSLIPAGIGSTGIADGDTVATSNLQRQFFYSPDDVGRNKATVLREKLALQNPDVSIFEFPFFLDRTNAERVIMNYDVVCDCSDNVEARLLADEMCAKLNKPLVYAAVRGWEGYLTVLNYKNKFRLNDFFSAGSFLSNDAEACSAAGIVNTTCGVLGNLQANEILKIILGMDGILVGEILCVDLVNNVFRKFRLRGRTS